MTNQYIGAPPSRPIQDGDHASVLALLPEYVMLRVLGQQPPEAWQMLEQHLSACTACRGEANALMRLMANTYEEKLQAVAAPPPNLSFLPKPRTPAPQPPGLVSPDMVWSVAFQFSPALLPRIHVPMAARSSGHQLRYHFERPPSGDHDPSITVEVFAADDAPDHGLVRVCVEASEGNPFDQPSSRVTLQAGERSWNAITDRNGLTTFPRVSLALIDQWRFTVAPVEPG